MTTVRTVLGAVEPSQLGVTQPHEHVLCDFTAAAGEVLDEPLVLENHYAVRTDIRYADNVVLDDVDLAVEELARYRAAGGGTVVESTTIGLGPRPCDLQEVSRRSGVHVVLGCGWYVAATHPADVATATEKELAGRLVSWLDDGVNGTGVRAGLIGELGLSWPHHPDEEKVVRAAVLAQQQTGVLIQLHPGRHADSPFDALGVVRAVGGEPTRVVMSHVERTLADPDDIARLADTGCYVEFDLFGHESSYYPLAAFDDMPNDAGRVRHLLRLIERGHRDQLLVSQDICLKAHTRRYGGEGYDHLLTRAVPLMRRMSMDDRDVRALLVDNPARALTPA